MGRRWARERSGRVGLVLRLPILAHQRGGHPHPPLWLELSRPEIRRRLQQRCSADSRKVTAVSSQEIATCKSEGAPLPREESRNTSVPRQQGEAHRKWQGWCANSTVAGAPDFFQDTSIGNIPNLQNYVLCVLICLPS